MGLESGTYIDDLVSSNPTGTDFESQGDDHLRLIKSVLQSTFPGASRAYRFPASVVIKTNTYTASETADLNQVIPFDCTAGACTLNLPATTVDGWGCWTMKLDSTTNAVTVDPSASDNINGNTTYALTKQYQFTYIRYVSAISAWIAQSGFNLIPYYSGAQDIPFSDIAPSANAKRILGAATATDFSEQTIATVLEWIGTCARGDILLRGASAFDRKALGSSGEFLKSDGTDLVYGLPLVPAYSVGTYASNASLSTTIPYDDTIPQISEGTEIISISITPIKSTSVIRVTFQAHGGVVTAGPIMAALFKDGAASAVQVGVGATDAVNKDSPIVFEYSFSPGSTSAITLAVRVGASSGNAYLNGIATGTRRLGGATAATLIAQEIFTA